MIDRLFSTDRLAALYDRLYPGDSRPDLAFYLPLVMSARSVLDVGCGTGALLCAARRAGHRGRLCGLDPADAMLAQARRGAGIEWITGQMTSARWAHEFDLIVMTGHVFQVFIDQDELRTTLQAIRLALTDEGHFAFETRNPNARAWETWTADNVVQVTDSTGAQVRMVHQVDQPVIGDVISFTTTFTSPEWSEPEVSRTRLRFTGVAALSRLLADAGFAIESQLGDWQGSPLTEASPEIITIASSA